MTMVFYFTWEDAMIFNIYVQLLLCLSYSSTCPFLQVPLSSWRDNWAQNIMHSLFLTSQATTGSAIFPVLSLHDIALLFKKHSKNHISYTVLTHFKVFILQSTVLPFSFLSLILSAPVDFQLMNLIWILPLQGCKSLFVSIFEQFASCQLFTIDNLMSNT